MNPVKKIIKFIITFICSETGRAILSIIWKKFCQKVNDFLSGKTFRVEDVVVKTVKEDVNPVKNTHDLREMLTVDPNDDYLTYICKVVLTDVQHDVNPEFDYNKFCSLIQDAFIKIGIEKDEAAANTDKLVTGLKHKHIPQEDVYKVFHAFGVHPGSVAVVYRNKEEIEKPYSGKIHVLD